METLELTGDRLTAILTERLLENPHVASPSVIAEFCGVRRKTVEKWLDRSSKPIGGVSGLGLWHLLETAGCDSPELAKIRQEYPLGEYLGRLLAFRVLKEDEVCGLAQVKKVGAILRAVRDEGRLIRVKSSLEELHLAYDGRLRTAEAKLRQKLNILPVAEPVSSRPRVIENVPSDTSVKLVPALLESEAARQFLLLDVSRTLAAALVAANFAIENFTPAERERLVGLMGGDSMLLLSHAADRLCSDRAYQNGVSE